MRLGLWPERFRMIGDSLGSFRPDDGRILDVLTRDTVFRLWTPVARLQLAASGFWLPL
jgi:hypothetical protein